MKFHILGVAHSIANGNYPTDPFTNKSTIMSRMLTEAGHEVIYYGVEGGDVVCSKFETIVSKNTFDNTYKTTASTRETAFTDANGAAWEEFIKNAPNRIKDNIQNESKEFLLCFFGIHHKPIADQTNLIVVEPGIGYAGTFANYRVFESYAWMHYVYGKEGNDWPHSYNCVIPNFYYPENHVFSKEKDDYFMFMGRIIWGKGVSVAAEIAAYFNKQLIVCGHGDLAASISEPASKANILYKGVVNFQEKTTLLSRASCFICPSLYVEPFGHVVPEASFAGTPVISTNYGAFTETVVNGINGFRCSVFRDYLEAVNNLNSIDSNVCRDFAENMFSVRVALTQYEKYFKNLLDVRNSPKGWYTY